MPRQIAASTMQPRTATWLVWALWAIFLLLHMAGAILAFLARSYPEAAGILPLFSRVLLYFPQVVAFLTIGALIAARQPRNPIGWLFLAGGFVDAFGEFAEAYWRYALFVQPGVLPAGELMLWINVRPYSIETIFTTLLILLFPTGRPLSRRWWIAGWLTILGGLINLGALAFMPGPLDASVSINNPVGLSGAASLLQLCADLGNYVQLLGVLGVILSLVVRLRRAHSIERQQIKLLAYALAIYAVTLGPIIYLATSSGEPSPILNIFFVLQAFAAVFIAVVAGIAILRYRLWDIDIIIRRTLVYSLLTLTLGLVYLGCILLSRTLVAPYIGGSELAIVASTLAIAALFNPLRRQIQTLIDKRFYRRKYDTAKVLAAFGATVRDETDLERLTAAMLKVVDETLQPTHANLWIMGPKREL